MSEVKYLCKQCGADIEYERFLNTTGVELCGKCIRKNHKAICAGKPNKRTKQAR